MEESGLQAGIRGGLRTLIQFVPLAGGALAQAWSEFESFHHNKRIAEFFGELKQRLEKAERADATLQNRIQQLEDAASLLERTVAAVVKEASKPKRDLLLTCFVHLISTHALSQPGDRLNTLEALDYLNEDDISVLRQFARTGYSRGDLLSQTDDAPFSPVGDDTQLVSKCEQLLAPIAVSTSKLEARGLILTDANYGPYNESGETGAWYNRFRKKAWRLMPAGRRLLQSLEVGE